MPRIYNIYYDAQGNIKSYMEGQAVNPAHETPPGTKLLALEVTESVEIWDKNNHRLTHKVDPATLHLIPIRGPKVLTPPEEVKRDDGAAVLNTTSGEVVPGATANPKGVSVETQSDVHTIRE